MAIGTADFPDYLALDGINISHLLIDVALTPMVQHTENTSGNESVISRFPTLQDYQITVSVGVNRDEMQMLLPLIRVGTHHIVYGIEGCSVGKPKHAQDFIISETSITGSVMRREKRYFNVMMMGAAKPLADMFNGDTF